MRRLALLLLLSVGVLTAPPSSAASVQGAQAANGDVMIAAMLPAAFSLAERGDDRAVILTLDRAIQPDIYDQLSPQRAYDVALLFGTAAYNIGEWETAHHALVLATRQSVATANDWDRRLHSAILAGDGADAYLAFGHLIALGEPALSSFSGRQLDRYDRLLGALPNASEARLGLGREMEREDWQPPLVYFDPSLAWLHYAQALLETGHGAKAKAVAGRITDPVVVMAMQSDRRFDRLIAAAPALQDAHAAAERYLATARDYVRENPRMLSGRIAVIRALDILDRPAEALPLADEATYGATRGPSRTLAFDDPSEEPVLAYWRSSMLISVGRVDEAIGARTSAAACHCSSLDALQLARALLDAGRPQDARKWLDGLTENGMGLEDRMALAQTRACVASELGDSGAAATDRAFLKDHETWDPEAAVSAALCAGDLDGATATIVRQLADPRTRLDALAALQTYAPEPGARKHLAMLRARWSKLSSQPSVQAAVTKVGRLKTFDLQRRGAMS